MGDILESRSSFERPEVSCAARFCNIRYGLSHSMDEMLGIDTLNLTTIRRTRESREKASEPSQTDLLTRTSKFTWCSIAVASEIMILPIVHCQAKIQCLLGRIRGGMLHDAVEE